MAETATLCAPSSNRCPEPAAVIERRCSDADVLQHMLEVESSRQRLERHARELSRLAEHSAMATRSAQELARNKSDLLATLSHEIRTPLNGIVGMINMLQSCPLGSTERDYVDVIHQAGDDLLRLIDDILDFSKIEAGRLEMDRREFQPGDVVRDATRLVQSLADRKGLRIQMTVDPEVTPRLLGDPARIRQILINFLSNAIKFTAEGVIQIRVSASPAPALCSGIRFEVIDSGIGISAEAQARLFQPFNQADASISRQFGGTGLGLAISKRLAELMEGSVGVESKLGEGSTFWFTAIFPIAEPSCPPLAPAVRSTPLPQPAPSGSPRILLVEDNPVNEKVAVLMLKKLGYQATVARNGREGVEAAAREKFDLIFMDCSMPEMDGLQATGAIRTGPNNGAEVPIVAMTANAFAQDRDACLAAGMSDYLSKPVREAELRAMLARWL